MRVAVLGAAHPHVHYALDEVARRPELELVAVAEADPALRAQFLGGTDVPAYERETDLLAAHDVDVAVVAGVYADRGRAAVAALAAGAHVLADKPLCTTPDELDAIAAGAARAGRHVSVMFEKRFYPATLAARRLHADGVLGDLALVASTGPHKLNRHTRPAWFLDGRYGTIAGDLPVHDLDLVLQLSGGTAGTLSALAGSARGDREDHVAVLMRTAGVTATVEASWLGPEASQFHGHYRMRLSGTEGTAEIDWAQNMLTVTTHRRDLWSVPLPDAEPRPAQYFFDAVLAGAEPEISTAQSILATRVALTAAASAAADGATLEW